MSARRLAVVMDPIESIKPHKDTTLTLLLEAQRRGWGISYGRLQEIWIRDGEACGQSEFRMKIPTNPMDER